MAALGEPQPDAAEPVAAVVAPEGLENDAAPGAAGEGANAGAEPPAPAGGQVVTAEQLKGAIAEILQNVDAQSMSIGKFRKRLRDREFYALPGQPARAGEGWPVGSEASPIPLEVGAPPRLREGRLGSSGR